MTAADINAMNLTTTAVDSRILRYAVIAGKTTSGRTFKILAHAKPGNVLQLSYVEVYKSDGSRYKYGQSINVPSSWTYDLDNLSLSGGASADIWWHVISNNVGFLERYSIAKLRLVWTL
jgi:hypothetical protein